MPVGTHRTRRRGRHRTWCWPAGTPSKCARGVPTRAAWRNLTQRYLSSSTPITQTDPSSVGRVTGPPGAKTALDQGERPRSEHLRYHNRARPGSGERSQEVEAAEGDGVGGVAVDPVAVEGHHACLGVDVDVPEAVVVHEI